MHLQELLLILRMIFREMLLIDWKHHRFAADVLKCVKNYPTSASMDNSLDSAYTLLQLQGMVNRRIMDLSIAPGATNWSSREDTNVRG